MTDTRDSDPFLASINGKLAQLGAASPSPPWCAAWKHLGPESTQEERLAVYKSIRDSRSLPDEAGFYLVSWQIDLITLDHSEEALREQEDRLEAIQKQHGLDEDESWPLGEGPPEYEEAQQQLHDAWDALFASKLEEFGEQEMALLFRTDHKRFQQISEAGRQFFHGPDSDEEEMIPDWLDGLLDAVAACVEADSPMGPLGLRYWEVDGFWEVCIYPTPVELLGGAHDGAVVDPGFSLDLEQLRLMFNTVAAFGWNALGLTNPEGPYVYVEGVYQDRDVYLQVLSRAPEDAEPGMKLDTTKRPRHPE